MLTRWNQAGPGRIMGGGEAWETGWPDQVRDRMLGMDSRMTARLLAIQEEKQFGDTVDWVIVRSQKLRLAAVTIWIQCCRKQGCFSLQFHSHGVQCSSTPQL